MARSFHHYSPELKQRLVEEIEGGQLSLREAARDAHTTVAMVQTWLREYGRFQPKRDIVEVVMTSEQARIAALEKALAEAHLKLQVFDELITQANTHYQIDIKKNGSSGNTGKRRADLEEEVRVIAIAIGHALQDFDLVVAAFEDAGGEREAAVIEDAVEVPVEHEDKALQWGEPTGARAAAPVVPPAARRVHGAVLPQLFEVVFQDVDDEERAIGGEEFVQAHALVPA